MKHPYRIQIKVSIFAPWKFLSSDNFLLISRGPEPKYVVEDSSLNFNQLDKALSRKKKLEQDFTSCLFRVVKIEIEEIKC
jgi:hypothetical protein